MNAEEKNKNTRCIVLIIEDSLLDFELMQGALKNEIGCEVHLVRTRAEFEDELAHETPNVIVSDSNMVLFDGMTALKLATDKCPGVPFAFCSGMIREQSHREFFGRKVDCVPKEVGFAHLVQFVKDTCKCSDEPKQDSPQ